MTFNGPSDAERVRRFAAARISQLHHLATRGRRLAVAGDRAAAACRGQQYNSHDGHEYGGSDGREIGLLGWVSASREETARLPALRAEHPGPLVAVVRELPNALGARTIAARLEGAVLAGELEQTLLPTLAAVAAGQCVVPRAIRQIVDRPPLSPRERQILAMVVLDFSNAEIARKLFVTESNVKNHLSSAFRQARRQVAQRRCRADPRPRQRPRPRHPGAGWGAGGAHARFGLTRCGRPGPAGSGEMKPLQEPPRQDRQPPGHDRLFVEALRPERLVLVRPDLLVDRGLGVCCALAHGNPSVAWSPTFSRPISSALSSRQPNVAAVRRRLLCRA